MNYKIGIIITLFCHILIIISFLILYCIAFDKECKTKKEECWKTKCKGIPCENC